MAKTTELPSATPASSDEVVGNASGVTSRFTVTGLKAAMALANVENTALSTWAGTSNITTLGTVAAGVWNGTPIVTGYIGDAAITAAKIAAAAVEASHLAASAVGTAAIADEAVTLAKMATLAQDTLIGRYSTGVGIPEAITIGEGLDLTAGVLSAIGGSGGGSGTFTVGGGGSAPELAPAVTGGAYFTTGTGSGTDALGLLWVNANNLAACYVAAPDLVDGGTYDVVYTVENYTGGSHRVLLYGDTTGQVISTPDESGNGTFTHQVTIVAGSGSQTNQIRVQATGSSGTNNFRVTALSVTQAGVGSYPVRSLTTKIKEMEVSVVDFGADSTGATDSTQAFEDAIAFGVRRIRVPAGTYKVTSLYIDQNVELIGDGRDQTEIQITGTGNIHGIHVRGNAALGRSNLIRMRYFKLSYTGAGQTAAGSGPGQNNWSGIYIQRKVLMDEVDVRDFTNDGIYYAPYDANEATLAGGTMDEAVFFSRMDNVWSKDNGRDGIAVRRGANANSFINCQFDRNGRHGFHHYTDGISTYGNTIRDGQCSYNHDHGYALMSGTNIVASGLYAELNGFNGTTGYMIAGMKDFYFGDSIVRSHIIIGVLYNQDTSKVRLPLDATWGTSTATNTSTIQIWEGGRRGFGAT